MPPAACLPLPLPQLSRYLKFAFPKAILTFRNGAIPATGSAYAYRCFERVVDDEVRSAATVPVLAQQQLSYGSTWRAAE
jgi:hypothetical protein